jgi:hypothetical protein
MINKADKENVDNCRHIFVSWQWTVGLVVMFLGIAISSSASFGYKIANMQKDIKSHSEQINSIEKTIERLDTQIIERLDSIHFCLKELAKDRK